MDKRSKLAAEIVVLNTTPQKYDFYKCKAISSLGELIWERRKGIACQGNIL